MTCINFQAAARASIAALAFTTASLAHADTIDVTVDTSFLNGLPAVLAFDFINGGPPDNSVALSALTGNGTQTSTSSTGNVTGTGPWTFSDAGGSFLNELLVAFNPMRTSLSFSFTTTDHPPAPGSLPDALSVFVLDSTATFPLITTNDPTQADALFLFNLGQGPEGLTVFTVDQSDFTVNASSAPTPALEPGIQSALLLAGVIALFARGFAPLRRTVGTPKAEIYRSSLSFNGVKPAHSSTIEEISMRPSRRFKWRLLAIAATIVYVSSLSAAPQFTAFTLVTTGTGVELSCVPLSPGGVSPASSIGGAAQCDRIDSNVTLDTSAALLSPALDTSGCRRIRWDWAGPIFSSRLRSPNLKPRLFLPAPRASPMYWLA